MNEIRNEKRILFAGGGTAGHLMPAINIAMEMQRQSKEFRALFVGKKQGIESGLVKKFGFECREIEVVAMKRSLKGILNFILRWRIGIRQAAALIAEFKPVAIVGTGGYLAAPVVSSGSKAGIPIFLQEQNSLPGLATRTLAGKAKMIFTAYESASRYLPADKCRLVGNPIRPGLLERYKKESLLKFNLSDSENALLVLGGSSGAHAVNEIMLGIIKDALIPKGWQLLWQTGEKDFKYISNEIIKLPFNGKVLAFIDDMPSAYAASDLILSRAGAMALSEITAVGIPSILIPFPHATGDHQTLNARELEKAGAAVVMSENEMTSKLRATLIHLMQDSELRRRMGSKAKELGKPQAAETIAKAILDRI